MWGFIPKPDPIKVPSQWIGKNNPTKLHIVARDGEYYVSQGGGRYTEASLREHYKPMADPWQAQKDWAAQYGFVWKDSL